MGVLPTYTGIIFNGVHFDVGMALEKFRTAFTANVRFVFLFP